MVHFLLLFCYVFFYFQSHNFIKIKSSQIRSVEQFGQDLGQHFLDTYRHVLRVQVHIEEAPWQRIQQEGKDHNHAFVITHQATRFADVIQEKYSKNLFSYKI